MQLSELIELAKLRAGNYARLAERLGATPQQMSDLVHGRRQWSPERVDELGELAGLSLDERAKLVWETVRRNAGKGLHVLIAGVVGTLCFGVNGDARAAAAPAGDDLNHAYV